MYQYNIAKVDGTIMLGCWVETMGEAMHHWLYYVDKYAVGKPYPNGRGFYPDFGFHIVWREV
jgi:hypothetical protein